MSLTEGTEADRAWAGAAKAEPSPLPVAGTVYRSRDRARVLPDFRGARRLSNEASPSLSEDPNLQAGNDEIIIIKKKN